MPLKLIEYLNEQRINTIIWAVSAMRIVENFKTFAKAVPKYLQLVMFSGEIMPVRMLNYWRSYVNAHYVNLYGPTEITCNCSYYLIDREFEAEEGSRREAEDRRQSSSCTGHRHCSSTPCARPESTH